MSEAGEPHTVRTAVDTLAELPHMVPGSHKIHMGTVAAEQDEFVMALVHHTQLWAAYHIRTPEELGVREVHTVVRGTDVAQDYLAVEQGRLYGWGISVRT